MPDTGPDSTEDVDSTLYELAEDLLSIMSRGENATLFFDTDNGLKERIELRAVSLNDQGCFRFSCQVFTPNEVMSPQCAAVAAALMASCNQQAIDDLREGPSESSPP